MKMNILKEIEQQLRSDNAYSTRIEQNSSGGEDSAGRRGAAQETAAV